MDLPMPAALRRRFDPNQRYGLRVTLFAIAVMLAAVPFGLLLEQVVRSGSLTRADTWVARELHGVAGRSHAWGVVAVAAGYLLLRRAYRLAVFLVVTAAGGGIIDTVVKHLVGRARPDFENPVAQAFGKSFPSGHAMSSMVVYGALTLIFVSALRRHRVVVWATAVALVVAIGISRLALGVHFLSDVIGGWVLGLAWLVASTAAFSIWRVERHKPPVDVAGGVEPEEGRRLGA
jgi:undecaprenyl-diphosphatase